MKNKTKNHQIRISDESYKKISSIAKSDKRTKKAVIDLAVEKYFAVMTNE